MKKNGIRQSLTVLLLCAMLTACGQPSAPSANDKSTSSVSAVLEQKTGGSASSDAKPSQVPEPVTPAKPAQTNDRLNADGTYDKIDLDLSALNQMLTFAELANMALMPEDYAGKVIKIKGNFSHFIQPTTKETHYTLFLMDATACCGQVLDFILHDPDAHPENEIAENSEITVTGLFEIYEENAEFGISSYRLIDSYIS